MPNFTHFVNFKIEATVNLRFATDGARIKRNSKKSKIFTVEIEHFVTTEIFTFGVLPFTVVSSLEAL